MIHLDSPTMLLLGALCAMSGTSCSTGKDEGKDQQGDPAMISREPPLGNTATAGDEPAGSAAMPSEGQGDSREPPLSGKVFTDERGGYSLRYPLEWTLRDHSSRDDMIRADLLGPDNSGLQIRILDFEPRDFNRFVDQYLRRFMDEMSSHHGGGIQELDRVFGALGQEDSCVAHIQLHRADGQQWLLLEYLWSMQGNMKNKVLVFQGGTPAERAESLEPEILSIARSLRLLP